MPQSKMKPTTPSTTPTPGRLELKLFPTRSALTRLLRDEGETVASFGAAELIRHHDGRWELRGGSPGDRADAHEWCSVFQHDATFPNAPQSVTAPKPDASPARHNHVLIVDDDSQVRGSLAAVLKSEGFEVEEAADGAEAVACATDHAPDLVLLDLNMPRMDGWTAFTQLDRVRPLVPVIVITARPNQYEQAVRLGVDAFMEKPLNFPVLLRTIHKLTHEAEEVHTRRITDSDYVTRRLGHENS